MIPGLKDKHLVFLIYRIVDFCFCCLFVLNGRNKFDQRGTLSDNVFGSKFVTKTLVKFHRSSKSICLSTLRLVVVICDVYA